MRVSGQSVPYFSRCVLAGLLAIASTSVSYTHLDVYKRQLLSDILAVFVPRGWFLPVTPGTRFITLGGAIANDCLLYTSYESRVCLGGGIIC